MGGPKDFKGNGGLPGRANVERLSLETLWWPCHSTRCIHMHVSVYACVCVCLWVCKFTLKPGLHGVTICDCARNSPQCHPSSPP